MNMTHLTDITLLGEACFPSPQRRTINDQARVSSRLIDDPDAPPVEELRFELAGPRARLFFDPRQTRAGIVTCGGSIRHYSALEFGLMYSRGSGELTGYTENLFRMAEVRMSLRGARWRLDRPAGWRPGQDPA